MQDRIKGEEAAEEMARQLTHLVVQPPAGDGGPPIATMPILDTLEQLARCFLVTPDFAFVVAGSVGVTSP